MKKEPDWARWRAWLIAASATTIPSGATAACGAWETSCAAYGDFSSDAAVDTSTRADAVVSGSACAPGDVSAFVPMWKPPTDFHQGLCTDVQTAAFVDCLSNVPDAPTCKTFEADPANKACVACAATPSTAAKYGPLVEDTVTSRGASHRRAAT